MAEYKKSTSNDTRYTLRLVVTESNKNTANNTSDITYKLYLDSSYPRFEDWGVTCSLKITGPNSQTIVNYSQTSKNTSMPARYESLVITQGTKTVTHDTTGGGSLSISCSFSTSTSASYLPGSASLSGTYTLSSIPRATDISCSGGTIGSSTTITLSRKSTSYYHKLYYKMSGQSSMTLIASGVAASSYSWTIPTSFYSLIPNSTKLTGTLYCYTYSNSACTTQVGEYKTCSVTVNTSESSCKPSINSLTLTTGSDTQSYTGNSTTIINGYSTVAAALTVTANNAANISSYKVTNGDVTKSKTVSASSNSITISDSFTFSNVINRSFTLTTTDTRGYSNSVTITPQMVDYINPDIAFTEQPSIDINGNLEIKIKGKAFNGSFGAVVNNITCKYYYKLSGTTNYTNGTFDLTKSGNTYSATKSITGLAYDKAYDVYCIITDTLHSVQTNTVTVSSVPIFDWGKDDFNFNVSVNINGGLNINNDITFENGEQTGARRIRFKNENGSYSHNCVLYGGNPESGTGIGCWDNGNRDHGERRIWNYSDTTNTLLIGSDDFQSTTKNLGTFYVEGHSSPIGSVIASDTKTGVSVSGSAVKNLTSLSIPSGTWIVIGGFWTSSFSDSNIGGSVRLCLGETASQIDKNPAGNSNGYGTNTYRAYGSSVFLEGEVVTIKKGDSASTIYLNVQQTTNETITFGGSIRAVRIA